LPCQDKIASWIGKWNGKDQFGWKTIKTFERDHFKVNQLQLITHGLPQRYVKGLKMALKSAIRKITKKVKTKTNIRILRPCSRVSENAWLWDNMYCVWRSRSGRTVKDAIICQFTHYTNSDQCPTQEPNKETK